MKKKTLLGDSSTACPNMDNANSRLAASWALALLLNQMFAKLQSVIALSLLVTAFTVQIRPVKATPPSPIIDHVIETANGKYVLVLLVPDANAVGEPDVTSPEIRAKYPRSGLYSQDGSLVWPIDWYLPPGGEGEWITLLDDGEHLITWTQPWPIKYVGQTACDNIELGFYKRGRELKSYRINELVRCPGRLERYESGYIWRASYSVDQATRTLRIHTTDGHVLDFDITTGEKTDANTGRLGWQYFFLATLGLIAISGLAVISLRTRRKRTKGT
jgi:hypothetical protein